MLGSRLFQSSIIQNGKEEIHKFTNKGKTLNNPCASCLIFLLKRWLRWSSVGKMKTHTYITHVAKSKIGSKEIIAPFFLD